MISNRTIVSGQGARGLYEVSFISVLDTADRAVHDIVQKNGGEITAKREMMQTTFAYSIKKHDAGYFGSVQFHADPNIIREIKKALDTEKDVVRFLLVKDPIIQRGEHAPSVRHDGESPGQSRDASKEARPELLTNEALEAKLEEILK